MTMTCYSTWVASLGIDLWPYLGSLLVLYMKSYLLILLKKQEICCFPVVYGHILFQFTFVNSKSRYVFPFFFSMIHGLHIKDGKATYVSRYVKTSRLKQEEFFGGAKFMKVGIETNSEICD